MGYPKSMVYFMENPLLQWDDLGVPLFQETSIEGYFCIYLRVSGSKFQTWSEIPCKTARGEENNPFFADPDCFREINSFSFWEIRSFLDVFLIVAGIATLAILLKFSSWMIYGCH